MDRKEFLKGLVTACCGAAACIHPAFASLQEKKKNNSPETPCDEKVKFTKDWIKRFMDILDDNLDEKTRRRIMEANGKACYLSHPKEPRKEKMSPEVFVKEMAKYVGKENCYKDGNNIYFRYTENPNGLKVSDGYCLCPMVEDGPENLSPTYCYCSVGYVSEMMNYYIGSPVKVELLESLRTGGKSCRFVINLKI